MKKKQKNMTVENESLASMWCQFHTQKLKSEHNTTYEFDDVLKVLHQLSMMWYQV